MQTIEPKPCPLPPPLFERMTNPQRSPEPVETEICKIEPIRVPHKTGRNQPCPCGSGVKYKRCCLNRPQTLGKALAAAA
jgi:preprotein translocase subunit SecA